LIAMGTFPSLAELRFESPVAGPQKTFSQAERLIVHSLLLMAVTFDLYVLHPEVAIRVPDLNDEVLHLLNLERTVTALFPRQDPTDTWLAPIDLGYPLFHYHQHLPYLPPAVIFLLLRGSVPLLDLFNWTSYLLLSAFPLSIYWSMRRYGFSRLPASLGGLVSPLLAANYLYGSISTALFGGAPAYTPSSGEWLCYHWLWLKAMRS